MDGGRSDTVGSDGAVLGQFRCEWRSQRQGAACMDRLQSEEQEWSDGTRRQDDGNESASTCESRNGFLRQSLWSAVEIVAALSALNARTLML